MEQRAEQEAEKPELGSQQLWLHMAEALRSSWRPGEETYNHASMGPQHCSWLGTSSPTPVQCLGPWGKHQGLACPHTHAARRRGHGRSRRCRAWLAPAELSALLHKSRAGQAPSSSRDGDSTDSWWNWHNPQTETVPETLIAVAGEVGLGDTGLHRGGCATYRVRMGKQRGCIRHPCPGTAPEASGQQPPAGQSIIRCTQGMDGLCQQLSEA